MSHINFTSEHLTAVAMSITALRQHMC